ncbi:ATP-binding protein [Brachyspira aalborgi]|uniref:ATP-binding protein n=1 Tax=Brachyspira aalborgi TaxID=29522 RepID=A0A5C8FAW1_9SPIR|nr:ATP-binding protein [Brachyspira aalborgi]TXJ45720.1 ATP-binding protein [Brachyspira aalborgi]
MYIENIELKNFTTFRNCKIDFSNGINIFIGENATGKTHLLKAIYCLNPSFYIKYKNTVYKSNITTTEYPFNPYAKILNEYEYNDIKDRIKELEIKILSFLLKDKKNININKELNKYLTELNQMANSWYLKFNNLSVEIKLQIDKSKIIKSVNDINHIFHLYNRTNVKDRETLFYDDKYLFNDKKFTYIPCKDIMTNSKGFTSLYEKREISFESIYNDILNKASLPQLRELDENFTNITKKIENAIGGIVVQHNELFFIEYKDFGEIEFTMVAEGHKKLALLWLLIKNGEIDKNTILLFDEPESNLNPKLTGVLVDILLSLSRLGVQIFIATHNNFIIDEFELQRNKNDKIKFHSFYFGDNKSKGVLVESNEYIDKIKHNAIENKFKEQHYTSIKKAFEK